MAVRKLKRNQDTLVKKSPGGTSSRNHEALDTNPRMSYGSCSKQIEKPALSSDCHDFDEHCTKNQSHG
ncbi:unnamed protein product [Sphagnum troendelagicum]|uniref:Uncharacterized protein n=1 Tax=Sphagnum troendelagicum TaxID=128251 RepID=A0ABP0UFP0_9BRYO